MPGPTWSQLFASAPPPESSAEWADLLPDSLPPAGGELWIELAKATDSRYERPRTRSGVQVERLAKDTGAILWYDEGEKEGAYIQLAPEDLFLWERLDGQRSQIDLVVDYCLRYKTLGATRVAALVESLRDQKLLSEPPDTLYPKLKERLYNQTFSGLISKLTQTFLQREFAVGGIDRFLTRLYAGGVWLLYTKPVQLICWILASSGLLIFLMLLNSGRFELLGSGSATGGAVALVLFQIVAIFMHELGHAFTVKRFGRRVRRAGLLLLYGMPGAFVDTTDIWPAGRKAQLWVTWAGPFTNLTVGGALALLAASNLEGSLAPLLFQFALAHYVLAFLNLTPFLRLDGYYLLSDWLQIPNMRPRSMAFWRFGLPGLVRQAWKEGRIMPRLSKEQIILAIFGAVCGLWLINLLGLAVITAPIRLFDTAGFLLNPKGNRSFFTVFLVLLGTLFTFLLLIRSLKLLKSGSRNFQRISRQAHPWLVTLLYAAIALFIAALPDLLSLQAARASHYYRHALLLATDALIVLLARRLVNELRGAPLRRGLLGMLLTGLVLGVVDFYAALQDLWLTGLPVLPHFSWLVAILPLLLVSAPATRTMFGMRRSAVGWTLILGQIATLALILAVTPLGLTTGNFLILAVHTFYAGGLLLHWQLAQRPLTIQRITLAGTSGQTAEDLLKTAVAAVITELAQTYRELAGQADWLRLVNEFNQKARQANWPLWLTREGEPGDQTTGALEERIIIYRDAITFLSSQLAATFGTVLAADVQNQALLELPRPMQSAFRRWIGRGEPAKAESQTLNDSTAIENDRVRLHLAARCTAEALVTGCARVYGWRLTEQALSGFNRTMALTGWSLYIRSQGRLVVELNSDLLSLSRIYAEALQDLLGRLAAICGLTFVERGLVQVYDGLPWEVREVAGNLLLARLSQARLLAQASSKDDQRMAFLQSIPLLGWLSPEEASTLASRLVVRKVQTGRVLVAANTYLAGPLIVRQGSVQVIETKDGVRQVVEQIGTGSIIGLRSTLEVQPVAYEYLAHTALELWLIPPELVRQQLEPLLQLQDGLDEERAKLALLARIPLFATLESEQRTRLAQALEVQRMAPGAVVLKAGEESQGFFIMWKGEVEVLVPLEDGNAHRISTLGPGEFFGESSLLSHGLVTATVRACTEVELLRLQPAEFYAFLDNSLAIPLAQVQSRRATERAHMTQMAMA